MNEKMTFCEECRKDVAYSIETVSMKGTLKGEEYSYTGNKAMCAKCGAEVYVAKIEDQNLKALYDVYRQKNGIIPLEKMNMNDYGKEIIIDLHFCDSTKFTRKNIQNYFKQICELIEMERCKLCWWDDLYTPENEKQTEPHLVGTSAVQFIKTSNITIHTLDILKRIYLNIFSCKDFDENIVIDFSEKWFDGKVVSKTLVRRI